MEEGNKVMEEEAASAKAVTSFKGHGKHVKFNQNSVVSSVLLLIEI